MDIKQRIDQDLKVAMLARDEVGLSVLRSLKSALTYASVDAKTAGGDGTLDDQAVSAVLIKEAKKRQDSADAFSNGGARERAEQELAEKGIIEGYLPAPITDDELGQLVDAAVAELGASRPQDMGKVIGLVRTKASGRIDGAKLAQMARERLVA